MINQDSYYYINWEDNQKNLFRIGVLARIDDVYYLKTFAKKGENERDAFSHGYAGLPGFNIGQVYKSTNKLFDFFLNRIYRGGANVDYMEELKKTRGRMLTDSFSVEEIPESQRKRCKELIVLWDKQNEEIKKCENKELVY